MRSSVANQNTRIVIAWRVIFHETVHIEEHALCSPCDELSRRERSILLRPACQRLRQLHCHALKVA